MSSYFESLVQHAHSQAAALSVALKTEAVSGHASQAIVEFARQFQADVIAIGQHGFSAVFDHLLGSTTDRVVDTAVREGDPVRFDLLEAADVVVASVADALTLETT